MLNASYITFNNDTYSNYTINKVVVKKIRSFKRSIFAWISHVYFKFRFYHGDIS